MAPGAGLTVTTVDAMHPVGRIKVIFVVPLAAPVNIPDEDPMFATGILLLAQVPPPVRSVSV